MCVLFFARHAPCPFTRFSPFTLFVTHSASNIITMAAAPDSALRAWLLSGVPGDVVDDRGDIYMWLQAMLGRASLLEIHKLDHWQLALHLWVNEADDGYEGGYEAVSWILQHLLPSPPMRLACLLNVTDGVVRGDATCWLYPDPATLDSACSEETALDGAALESAISGELMVSGDGVRHYWAKRRGTTLPIFSVECSGIVTSFPKQLNVVPASLARRLVSFPAPTTREPPPGAVAEIPAFRAECAAAYAHAVANWCGLDPWAHVMEQSFYSHTARTTMVEPPSILPIYLRAMRAMVEGVLQASHASDSEPKRREREEFAARLSALGVD